MYGGMIRVFRGCLARSKICIDMAYGSDSILERRDTYRALFDTFVTSGYDSGPSHVLIMRCGLMNLDLLATVHENDAMWSWRKIAMNIFRVPTFLLIVALTFAIPSNAADPATISKGLVQDAVTMFEHKGRDYTLRVLSNISGPFRKGSIYAFAVSMNGVMLAHPANKDLVGKDVTNMKDWNGTRFFREMVNLARGRWERDGWNTGGSVTAKKNPPSQEPTSSRSPTKILFVAASYYAK